MKRLPWKHLACLQQAALSGDGWNGAPYGYHLGGTHTIGAEVSVPGPRGQFVSPRQAFLILENLAHRGLVRRDEVNYVFVITDKGTDVLEEHNNG